MKQKGKRRKGRPGVGRQRGGTAPLLAAAIPALVSGGKAVGLGVAANYGTRKALRALEKKKYKRRRKRMKK